MSAVVTTEFLDAPLLKSPIEFRGGKWVTKIQPEMKGIYLSMMEQLLEDCGPFIRVIIEKFPEKMFFSYYEPTLDEIREFIYM